MANSQAANYFMNAYSSANEAEDRSGDPAIRSLAEALQYLALGLKAMADKQ